MIELSKSKSCRKIADEFCVPKTKIQSIVKKKAEVLADFEDNVALERKRRYNCANADINDLMWTWFQDASSRKILITGPLLQETARLMAKNCNNDPFTASNGWLESFIKRHIVFWVHDGQTW